MILGVKERIVLETLIQTVTEGNYETIKAKKSVVKKITFDTTELEKLEYKTEFIKNADGQVVGSQALWNKEKETSIEVEFSSLELKLLIDILTKLNQNNKLNEDTVDLYENIVPTEVK